MHLVLPRFAASCLPEVTEITLSLQQLSVTASERASDTPVTSSGSSSSCSHITSLACRSRCTCASLMSSSHAAATRPTRVNACQCLPCFIFNEMQRFSQHHRGFMAVLAEGFADFNAAHRTPPQASFSPRQLLAPIPTSVPAFSRLPHLVPPAETPPAAPAFRNPPVSGQTRWITLEGDEWGFETGEMAVEGWNNNMLRNRLTLQPQPGGCLRDLNSSDCRAHRALSCDTHDDLTPVDVGWLP
jgi:hypothetical protein